MKFGCMELEMMVANLQKFCVEATKQFRELASFLLYTACDWTLRVLPVQLQLELGFSCLSVCDLAASFGLCLVKARVVWLSVVWSWGEAAQQSYGLRPWSCNGSVWLYPFDYECGRPEYICSFI